MVAKSTTIAAASSPATVGIARYVNDYDGAYCIVQIVDETNDIYEFAEVMMVDDGALTASSSDYNTIKDNIQYKSGNR